MNPGGSLAPPEVVGRDDFIASLWRALARQSLVLSGERRTGKTSVLRKMLHEPAPGMLAIKRSLQGVATPEEFARTLVDDAQTTLPGLLRRSLGERLRHAGVKSVGVSSMSFTFEPAGEESWKDVVEGTLNALDREPDVAVVLLWDELPHMVANVRHNRGPGVARQLLDLLRAARERHARLRMVLSGSLGLHHVLRELRAHGGMWVPTHDMLQVDLPPLRPSDAAYLARELLRNEEVSCDDLDGTARAIARDVDGVPYYVHHVVHALMERQRAGRCGPVDAQLARAVVAQALTDTLDPWQLRHYVDRVETYYDGDAHTVKAILDVLGHARRPLTLERIHEQIGAHVTPPRLEQVRELVALLCKDRYLVEAPGSAFAFRLALVRRAWMERRR